MFASIIGDAGNGNVCTGYASKVADFLTYLSVSYDILNRWAYPLVPEANISLIGKKVYTVARHNVYKVRSGTLNITLKEGLKSHTKCILLVSYSYILHFRLPM